MNKNINILLNSLQDLDAFSDELERLEGEEYEKGLWDSTRPYGDLYDGLHMLYNYFPKTKKELQKIIKERLIDAKQEDPNKIVNLNDIDVSGIRSMSYLFCIKEFLVDEGYVLNNVDISKWDVSNVRDMSYMFYKCKNFNCDLSRWKVSNVRDMSFMFCECGSFVGKGLEKWNVSKVKKMNSMFTDCEEFNSDLSGWNVSNVEDMTQMFINCLKLRKLDLSNWNVSKVKKMYGMFHGCTNFNGNLTNWDVSKVKSMGYMFGGCSSFEGVGLKDWDVSNVEYFFHQFDDCKALSADLRKWDLTKAYKKANGGVIWFREMFNGCEPRVSGLKKPKLPKIPKI